MPNNAESVTPIIKGCRVSKKALIILPFIIIANRARMVSKNVGNAILMGTRPAYSQTPKKISNDRIRHPYEFKVSINLGGAPFPAKRDVAIVFIPQLCSAESDIGQIAQKIRADR